MKRKHADVIIAWANGAKVQSRELRLGASSEWYDIDPEDTPGWLDDFEYRVKPEEVYEYRVIGQDHEGCDYLGNVGLTIDELNEYISRFAITTQKLLKISYLEGEITSVEIIEKENI